MPEPSNQIQTEEYGDQVREVLSKPPSWLTRTGSVLVLFFLLSVLLLAYFVRYPDVLMAEVTISQAQAPVKLVARVDGRIQELLVNENELVTQGQTLAVLENTAHLKDVAQLKNALPNIERQLENEGGNIVFIENWQLGSIQFSYAKLVFDYQLWQNYQSTNSREQQLVLLRQQQADYRGLLTQQAAQQENLRSEYKLMQAALLRSEKLYQDSVIALTNYETTQREALRLNSSLERAGVEVSETQILISNLERQILTVNTDVVQNSGELRLRVMESFQAVRQTLVRWEQNYLLLAPIAGRLSYLDFWEQYAELQAGEEVFAIVAEANTAYQGKARVPLQNAGKLEIGQKAQVKLANYPYQEHGMLQGTLAEISTLPKQGHYLVIIHFEEPLLTQLGKPVAQKEEITGQLEIITEELSLLQRIGYTLRGVFE